MNKESPRVRSLLRQAKRNVEAGKLAAAEAVYRQIIEESPESASAWLGLAEVTRDEAEKEAAYNEVLALDQGNEKALVGLSYDRGKPPEKQSAAISEIEGQDNKADEGEQAPQNIIEKNKVGDAGGLESWNVENMQPAIQGQDLAVSDDNHAHGVVDDLDTELFCYRHPDRSTSLRCYKCNNPICSECTVKTPVGYLCPTCHRDAEDAFFNNKPIDYLLSALVALPLSLIAGWLVVRFSGGFFMILIFIFAGGAVGGFIARLAKRVINKRRGRFIPHVVAGCIVIGVLVFAWPWILVLFAGGGGALFKLAGIGVYLFTASSSAYYWAR